MYWIRCYNANRKPVNWTIILFLILIFKYCSDYYNTQKPALNEPYVAGKDHKIAVSSYAELRQDIVTMDKLPIFKKQEEFEGQRIMSKWDYFNITNPLDLPKFQFLKNYKNPCWDEADPIRGSNHTYLRCLPYFFLAGLEKCGTTDLYNSLTLHHEIIPPNSKERHFWNRLQYHHNFQSYVNWFNQAAKIIQQGNYNLTSEQTLSYNKKITLDASADTLLQQYSWRKFSHEMERSNLRFSVPYLIKSVLPNAKFVVILRNPVHRLYSSYAFYMLLPESKRTQIKYKLESKRSKSPLDFHKKTVLALQWFNNCTEKYGPYAKICTNYNAGLEPEDIFLSKLQGGLYADLFEDWFKYFSREQFKIVSLEEYTKDNYAVVSEIFSFLGVESISRDMFYSQAQKGVAKKGATKQRIGSMFKETYDLLKDFYFTSNERFAHMLNDSCFHQYNLMDF